MFEHKVTSQPCLIIAEAGVNHNGNLQMAYQLIDAAIDAKADVVKFQLFDPDELVTEAAPLAEYQSKQTSAQSQKAMLESLTLPKENFIELKTYAESHHIQFLCSPFDWASAQFLVNDLKLTTLKIASGELTNLPFLKAISGLNCNVILSTGMATLEEVSQAVSVFPDVKKVSLLHCVSAYPAPAESLNLSAMETLKNAFPQCVIGFSDHTLGWHLTCSAVTLGAQIIEKHLTLDNTLEGPDHKASLNPEDFKQMVQAIRDVEAAQGDGVKQPHPIELDVIKAARKSLVAAHDLPAGHILTQADIAVKRPGTGISPTNLNSLIGTTLEQAVVKNQLLKLSS